MKFHFQRSGVSRRSWSRYHFMAVCDVYEGLDDVCLFDQFFCEIDAKTRAPFAASRQMLALMGKFQILPAGDKCKLRCSFAFSRFQLCDSS